jgi:hypothetical protein
MDPETIQFINKLVVLKIPYEWWNPDECMICDDAPFWSFHNQVPNFDKIRSCNSAGLINLLRRFHHLEIPGVNENDDYSGGTKKWEDYLRPFLVPFYPTHNYAPGTLLLRCFRNINDQGHLAVVIDENKILHCRSGRGICIEEKKIVYNIFKFEFIISNFHWLK